MVARSVVGQQQRVLHAGHTGLLQRLHVAQDGLHLHVATLERRPVRRVDLDEASAAQQAQLMDMSGDWRRKRPAAATHQRSHGRLVPLPVRGVFPQQNHAFTHVQNTAENQPSV